MSASKAAVEVINVASRKHLVTGGPCLWVSKLLHEKGVLSSNRIWEEYLKDQSVEKDLIKSKSYLKNKILYQMHLQGKIDQGKAIDMTQYNKSGWALNTKVAFKNIAPDILAQIEPLPVVTRKDYKEYLRNNNIPYDF
ncbi:UNKNOWN [Stylonychia lemnae]|uniref:Uncharacterized protein n=1 Tax=Stylonychia lemnae TaxID=5949 RepID=A0A078ATI4_STYLE|nr:UNKNOWN [Stylonychia lemnae]|eukprot:CDW84497.1 UNKNOWN [Stylonychia lemnae]